MKELYDTLQKATVLKLAALMEGQTKDSRDVEKLEQYLMFLVKPKTFSGKNSAEINIDKKFAELCILISEHTKRNDVEKLSVLDFYSSISYIKKKLKANQAKKPR